MARLAWFTPLPPVRSGIAAYNAELLPLLAAHHDIEVFVGEPPSRGAPLQRCQGAAVPAVRVFSAHDFVWKHDRHPYDLVVYQLGNAACHDFTWPYLARYPGLVVLHDGQLHHERSRALLSRERLDDYRAEFRYNHPEAPRHFPDLVVAALGGSLYYLYPMVRWVVRTARLVGVHSPGLLAELQEAHPGVEVKRIRQGVVDPLGEDASGAGAEVRARHGIPGDAVLFAAFGLVTPEKRIGASLRALARVAAAQPNVYLLLAGETRAYYDVEAEARALGVADRVRIAGYVPDEALAPYLLAADVCLCLRWPTSRETSAMWIRSIAAGTPTIVTDLAHTTEIPALTMAGLKARPAEAREPAPAEAALKPRPDGEGTPAPAGAALRADREPAVSIAVDLLDEDESLYRAMTRLAEDADLRRELGTSARAYWQEHHTTACAVEDYLQVIARALARPVPRVRDLPRHLVADHTGLARVIGDEMGVPMDWLGERT